MKIFIDTANLQEIEDALKRGFLSGITTNPSLMAKEPRTNFIAHIKKIVELCKKYDQNVPLSIEVFKIKPDDMVEQALEFVKEVSYEQIVIKIPIGYDELEAIRKLSQKNIPINCTACMTESQMIMAANAGARYVSIFYNRLKDIGGDPNKVIENTRKILDKGNSKTEIIVGSIRSVVDVTDAHSRGAHIITVPDKILKMLTKHPKTTEAVNQFIEDFKEWMK